VHKVGNKIECNNMHGERIKIQLCVHVGPIFYTVITKSNIYTDSQVTLKGLFNNTQTMLVKCMAVQSDGS